MTNELKPIASLSKPANTLVEKVSDAVGEIARPWQIKRVAKAEADAKKTQALADVEVTEIEQRGLIRLAREQGQQQENIEQITYNALPHLSENANPESIEDDWLVHFFDRSRIVSDEEMQTLWSKILAGEANDPGAFSKRTVDLVASLDKTDAQMFTRLGTFVWKISDGFSPIIFDHSHKVFAASDIKFFHLSHLDDIGLVDFDPVVGFHFNRSGRFMSVSYHGREIVIDFQKVEGSQLKIGTALLTQIGKQLTPLCGANPSEGYFSFVLSEWLSKGIAVSSRIPPSKG